MTINEKQQWSISKLLRIRKVEIKDINGPRGEIYVKAEYSDRSKYLLYEITKKGVINLQREVICG